MKHTTNTNSLLRWVGVLSLAASLMSHAIANPSQGTVSTNSALAAEPCRFYDLEKGRFVFNPDYRAPASVQYPAQRTNPMVEPRRIFDPESGNFVSNPAYHEPAPTGPVVRRVGEPRRIFDVRKGRFELNPDYR